MARVVWRGQEAQTLSDQPVLQAETYDVIGQVYRSLGQNDRAVELLQKAVALRRASQSGGDPDLSASLRHLSRAFVDLRRLEEAEQTALEALHLDQKANSPPDESIARSLTSQGLFEEAEAVIREVIDWQRRNLPSNHPNLAESVDHLAVSLRNRSKFEEAEPFYEESLSIKREVYGDAHPSVAAGVMNLGIFHGIQGDYVGAEPYFKEAVTIYTEVLALKARELREP